MDGKCVCSSGGIKLSFRGGGQDVELNKAVDGRRKKAEDILVFPAASRPSIKMRISLLPKIFAMAFESGMPISFGVYVVRVCVCVCVEDYGCE